MSELLRIATAMAAGGTGKTTFATGLAVTRADGGTRTTYVDCAVPEPNSSHAGSE